MLRKEVKKQIIIIIEPQEHAQDEEKGRNETEVK